MREREDPTPLLRDLSKPEGGRMDKNNEGAEVARRLARQWLHEETELIPSVS